MIPTLAQLKNEITTGPLAAECAPYWNLVFNDSEPLRTKLYYRQGYLLPDAAFEILQILTNSSKRTRANSLVSKGAFLASIAPLTSVIATLPDVPFKAWSLVLNLATGGDEEVNLARPSIVQLFESAVASNLITEEQKTAILNQGGTSSISRAEELGWNITLDAVQACKLEGLNANINP